MSISFTQVLIWIIIAAVVGVVGELIARRRAPDGSKEGGQNARSTVYPGRWGHHYTG